MRCLCWLWGALHCGPPQHRRCRRLPGCSPSASWDEPHLHRHIIIRLFLLTHWGAATPLSVFARDDYRLHAGALMVFGRTSKRLLVSDPLQTHISYGAGDTHKVIRQFDSVSDWQ